MAHNGSSIEAIEAIESHYRWIAAKMQRYRVVGRSLSDMRKRRESGAYIDPLKEERLRTERKGLLSELHRRERIIFRNLNRRLGGVRPPGPGDHHAAAPH